MSEPFSQLITADTLPAEGRLFHVEADEPARKRVAEALGIAEVPVLSAAIRLKPLAGGLVSAQGEVRADAVQADVVTLEPVRQSIAEPIDVVLRPAEGAGANRPGLGDETSADEADLYFNGRIDLGALAREHLALALDPYPRAPGVEFTPHIEDDPTKDKSPFSALERLKSGDGSSGD
jgi:hypothetical protein